MDYAEALERFADSQQIDQMCLLGHSLGCLMAAAFALRCPGRVTHLVLASPALGYQVPVGDTFALRFEARGYATLVNSSGGLFCSGGCVVSIEGDVVTQGELMLGLSARF